MQTPHDEWFARRFGALETTAWFALGGAFTIAVGLLWTNARFPDVAWVVGGVLLIPMIFQLLMIPIWHWRERYQGTHPDAWGALLVFETSSWCKLVYWFRHVIPDKRGTGRYRRIVDRDAA